MVTREVTIRDVQPMEVLAIDHTGPYTQIGQAFDTLGAWLAARNLLSPGIRMIGIFYDNPNVVEEAKLRSKAAALLPPNAVLPELTAPVVIAQIRGGQYAVLRHKGPYADLHSAYTWCYGEWLAQSGRQVAEATYQSAGRCEAG